MGDGDDLPIFRPKLGKSRGRGGTARATTFRNSLLAAVYRAGGTYRKAARAATRRRVRIYVRPPGADLSRRVVVKARFVKMTRSGAKAAALHLRYIEREASRGTAPRACSTAPTGPRTPDVRGAQARREAPVPVHRLARGRRRARSHRLRPQLHGAGREGPRPPLEWAAVNHYDTEPPPRAHRRARRRPRGREVRFDREYISNGLRWRAQELATLELGPRTELEIQRRRAPRRSPRTATRPSTGSSNGAPRTTSSPCAARSRGGRRRSRRLHARRPPPAPRDPPPRRAHLADLLGPRGRVGAAT